MLMTEIKNETDGEMDTMFFDWKNQYCQKEFIFRFSAIPIRLPMAFFTELEQKTVKIWKHKISGIVKATLRKKQSWRNQAA